MLKLVRIILFSLYFVVVAVLGVFVCLCRPFNLDNNRIMAKAFSYGGLKLLGVNVEVRNEERFKKLEPGVIVSNHQSNLDLYVLGCIVPHGTASIGKRSLKWIPFFGQLYWLAGNVLIDRRNAKSSIDALGQVSEAINDQGRSIWVFAEGTRNLGKGLGEFKKGAFHIAVQAQCKITPIAASTYAGRLDLNKWCSGKVLIDILPAVDAAGKTEDDIPQLCASMHAQIREEIEKLDAELAQI
ncbi:hypothetical protein A3715_01115 [Oleiphilus sp. HI0009]|nr:MULTISPECIES: 1-acylglycerol-3-phosphate O-acyltransferase [unclassified Oleiphilus]KZX82384.1 hypothetical protein A3715_01115 [Oleiphilus sp. HI0009]KZY64336.1 hypothetical protein A3738_10685 [Oleiphilus sp. HI0066]KZY74437.1 hypothetical protein A3739_02305 [Oleiphilus sp. HI0067]MCH2159723.1 1-acylglycerol-3-phosphate O-acyltransferase [Oleiphilaceae bacterium]